MRKNILIAMALVLLANLSPAFAVTRLQKLAANRYLITQTKLSTFGGEGKVLRTLNEKAASLCVAVGYKWFEIMDSKSHGRGILKAAGGTYEVKYHNEQNDNEDFLNCNSLASEQEIETMKTWSQRLALQERQIKVVHEERPAFFIPLPAAEIVPDEEEGDENIGGDENVTATLRESGLGHFLPENVVHQVDIKKEDANKPVAANEGYEFFWAHITIDRIDGISISSPNVLLVDSAGESYSPIQAKWTGMDFVGGLGGAIKMVVGGFGWMYFVIPEEATPASLAFTCTESSERRAEREARSPEPEPGTGTPDLPKRRDRVVTGCTCTTYSNGVPVHTRTIPPGASCGGQICR